MKKRITAILLTAIILLAFCGYANAYEKTHCEHEYCFTEIGESEITYTCTKCNDTEIYDIRSVYNMFIPYAYNKPAEDTIIGYLLDVVNDGYVNAKDYAKLRLAYKEFIKNEGPDLDIGDGF